MLTIPPCILVDQTTAQVRDVAFDAETETIVLTMQTTAATAPCPVCHQDAHRVHSRYHRTLADAPWAFVPVRILLLVRRFFCDTPDCQRQTFTERLPTIAQPYARRTTRLARIQQQLGMLLGGSAGTVVCAALGCPAGVDLLLTLIRRRQLPELPTPRVLGLDDWALRKGQRYGSILGAPRHACGNASIARGPRVPQHG